jgi:hypothetical protein
MPHEPERAPASPRTLQAAIEGDSQGALEPRRIKMNTPFIPEPERNSWRACLREGRACLKLAEHG